MGASPSRVPTPRSAERLDLATGRWSPLPEMRTAHRFSAAAVLDGALCLMGGEVCGPNATGPTPMHSDGCSSVERLDLATWQWRALPRMNSARNAGAAVAVLGLPC